VTPEALPSEVDPRPRRLLERYASLVGGMVMEVGPDLLRVELPPPERARLGAGKTLLVALSPAALDEEPEAEILVVGSALLGRLVEGIRERGSHDLRGHLAATLDPSPEAARLHVPAEGLEAGVPDARVVALPVGRLLARVSIQSGPSLVERLVESSVVDLTVGTPVPPEIAAACEAAQPEGAQDPNTGNSDGTPIAVPRRPIGELLPLLFSDLERQLAAELARIRDDAARACAAELGRLDAYYGRMLAEVDPDDDPAAVIQRKAAIEADHARRRADTEHRYQVRITAHPIQLVEWRVPAQRAEWELRGTTSDSTAKVAASRMLVGDTTWRIQCPGCGAVPGLLRLCHHGHLACDSCSRRCGVCGEAACNAHGATTCAVEGHPTCDRHAATCPSCGQPHCTSHAARCAAQDHSVCSACVVKCGRCGLEVCKAHGVQTHEDAPMGSRWLCGACTVYCEGGSNEPVGLDEVERCTSCERYVCNHHAVSCVVDGRLHCSRHLRRSDRSGRLVCEAHRAACADEPDAILAADEVAACATCARAVCGEHGGDCTVDGARHCRSHLSTLRDQTGRLACERHRSVCAVDGVTYSVTGTAACPVCEAAVCAQHRALCRSCGRIVCSRDLEASVCRTCRRLEPLADPDDALIAAALEANRGEPPRAKGWRAARDAAGTVVELDFGWRRRLVFTVPHGESQPATAMYHSLLGSERRR
jgi:hypothetical protein